MCLCYKEAKAMENKLLKKLYDIFYTPPDFLLQQQEVEEGRRALDKVLDKQMYRMVIQIIDAKDSMIDNISMDSFISGFELARKLSLELNNYENERVVSQCMGRLGARCIQWGENEEK